MSMILSIFSTYFPSFGKRDFSLKWTTSAPGNPPWPWWQRLPIDLLKLDRYFLVSAAHSKRHAEIIHFIIQLAQSLDLHILAEGVETKEQADYLLSSGCTFAQGYLYGKPMPAEEFLQKY